MANVIEIVIRAKDDASKVLQGVGANMQTIGKIALGGLGTAATAVAGLGVAVTKLAMDAAPLQQIESAFAGLAESAGSGMDEMLAALQQGSAGMVTNRDLMLSFNKAAQLVGQDFAVQLPDAMQYLGKVSAATGQDMGFLLDSLVVGVGRLSPMILDNLGIQVSLAEASEEAAKMFGVEAGELTKAQQQAGMMNVALAKLATNTASMPDVAGSAAAGIANLGVMFQNTKDEIGTAFLPILGEALGIISQLAEQFLPPLLEKVQQLGELLLPVAEAISDFVGRILAGQDPLTSFKVLLMELLPPDLFFKVLEIIDGIEQFIGKVTEAFAPIAEWIGQNVQLSDILIALGATIATVIVPALAGIIAAVAPVIATFLLVVATVAALRAAWENDFLGIRTFVEETLTQIRAFWAENGDAIMAKATEIWQTVKETVTNFLQNAADFISTTLANIKQWWVENGDAIKAKATEIWEGVVATFEWFKGQFEGLFQAFRSAQEGDWRAFGEKLREIWDNAWNKFVEIVSNIWDKIKQVVSDAIENVKGLFSNTDWGTVGKSIIEGIANGISSAAGAIANAAKNAAQNALDAAKGFLGIESPSKLFAKEVGTPIAQGWAEGISDNAFLPARAASRAALSTFDYARDGTLATGGGNQYATSHIYIERVVIENANNATDLLQQLQQMAVM